MIALPDLCNAISHTWTTSHNFFGPSTSDTGFQWERGGGWVGVKSEPKAATGEMATGRSYPALSRGGGGFEGEFILSSFFSGGGGGGGGRGPLFVTPGLTYDI